MAPRRPLVSPVELESTIEVYSPTTGPIDEPPRKRWYEYLPLCATVLLILSPHPSLLYVLVKYHLLTRQQPIIFATHLLVTYTLTFLAFSSLIVCIARDPGPVNIEELHGNDAAGDEVGMSEALMADFDFSAPGMWCRKCWAPKPERTHHCTSCGRCVLKMDHHCPWLGGRCVGHRTYPAFIHFLGCITLLAVYIAIICISALWWAFSNPLSIDAVTPVHEIFLSFAGVAFTLVVGSFFSYHVYLVTTNQTTIENLSPFLLLRHLPPLPRGHSLSDPPLEPELSYAQRVLVKDAHGHFHLYDVGWRRNWEQVAGWKRPYGWIYRLLYGGATNGDGKSYPKNPRAEELLARLATELVKVDKDR